MGGFLTSVKDSNTLVALYSYPTNAFVSKLLCEQGEIHQIWGTDASPVANYANAPNGSFYTPQVTSVGVGRTWVKSGTFGTSDGTWSPGGAGSKQYVGKGTQSSTDAPVLTTALVNQLGGTITPARTSIGLYTFTLTGAFTAAKTFARMSCGAAAVANMRVCNPVYTSADVITFHIADLQATPAVADSGNFDLLIDVFY
jgi:hypothetical protein